MVVCHLEAYTLLNLPMKSMCLSLEFVIFLDIKKMIYHSHTGALTPIAEVLNILTSFDYVSNFKTELDVIKQNKFNMP
jgi:hypothetical protein